MSQENRRVEILLEDIQCKVGAIAEGHSVLMNKIDDVESKLSKQIEANAKQIKSNDDNLKQAFKMLSHDIQQVDKKLDLHIAQPA